MKIFNTAQIRAWDLYTIEHEPVSSVALMNRAAAALVDFLLIRFPSPCPPFYIICGTGNNGGDGVAAARLLDARGIKTTVWIGDFSGKRSADFEAQVKALPPGIPCHTLSSTTTFPSIPTGAVIIDALFGSGLTREPQGDFAALIQWINTLPNTVVAVDLPSGLFADQHTPGIAVEADLTFSFQAPKRAFLFPENASKTGTWTVGDIGLHQDYYQQTTTPFFYLTLEKVRSVFKKRQKFDHKGTFGHALLIAGSYGKMGAAVLSARACLRAGAGLLTVHAPTCGHDILQTGIPEAMYSADSHAKEWTMLPRLEPYKTIGLGPGIGTSGETAGAMELLLKQVSQPIVIDADALNLLAKYPEWWSLIPAGSILTPHPKEFERLFGPSANHFERNDLQRQKAQEHQVVIVLKGAFTAIALPNGDCWFNSTGNPGMATGGSGDVLTGILTGLLAQQYTSENAALLGVFLHGLAGDYAGKMPGMIAGDIVDNIRYALDDINAQP